MPAVRRLHWRSQKLTMLLSAIAVALVGAWLAQRITAPVPVALTVPALSQLDARFAIAAQQLVARDYLRAVSAWRAIVHDSPLLPEAHVNLGFALLGVGRHQEAHAHFERATQLRPGQANAYYGLGLAADRLGDRESAKGAMRVFVHLADPASPHVRRARAALWEWQSGAK